MLAELIVGAFLGIILGICIFGIIDINRQINRLPPCELDHNGECLICDCWISDCAYKRYLNKDYTFETKEELEQMFKNKKQ